jgi:thioester reductase-like protein
MLLANARFSELVAAARAASHDVMTTAALRVEVRDAITRAGLDPLAPARPPSTPTALAPDATLLITGATGFVGRHLLACLRQHHRGRILALVRGRDRAHASTKLSRALADASARVGPPDPDAPAPELVLGDLAAPRLGLDPHTWDRLAAEVDGIVHGGAIVHLGLGFAALRPTNLDATATLLALATLADFGAKPLHYLSTLSVFVAATPTLAEPREDHGLDLARELFGGYAQSKWAAEQLVRALAPGRVPASIYRLGLITGATTDGRGPARDQLGLTLAGLVELGAVPVGHAQLRVDLTPVDVCARALAALILAGPPAPLERPRCYHLASPNGASAAELVAALRRAGHAIEQVDAEAWRRLGLTLPSRSPAAAVAYLALARALAAPPDLATDPALAAPSLDPDPVSNADADLASRARVRAYDLFQATGFRFDDREAAAVLEPLGLRCPPSDLALLDRYVAAALAQPVRGSPP